MLEILIDDKPADMALVDIAVFDDVFLASRAVWDFDKVPQLFMSRCRPDTIGLSSVGGQLQQIEPDEPRGLALELGPDGATTVEAAIAPGRFKGEHPYHHGDGAGCGFSCIAFSVSIGCGRRERGGGPTRLPSGGSPQVRGPLGGGRALVLEQARRAGLFVSERTV